MCYICVSTLQVVETLIVSKKFRFYPPGGFLNMINPPQVQGENLHLVGQVMTFNPMSSPPPVNAYGTGVSQPVKQGSSTNNNAVHIDIDSEDTIEPKRGGTKRFWTLEEETRLVITDHFVFLSVGNCLVQFLICSFFICIL